MVIWWFYQVIFGNLWRGGTTRHSSEDGAFVTGASFVFFVRKLKVTFVDIYGCFQKQGYPKMDGL